MAKACIWCGHELVDETTNDDLFACGSSHRFFSDTWSQSKGCVEIMQSRERIQRAVEVLEAVTRFDVIPWDGGVSRDPSDGGGEVDADVVDLVIEILKGETDGKAE